MKKNVQKLWRKSYGNDGEKVIDMMKKKLWKRRKSYGNDQEKVMEMVKKKVNNYVIINITNY